MLRVMTWKCVLALILGGLASLVARQRSRGRSARQVLATAWPRNRLDWLALAASVLAYLNWICLAQDPSRATSSTDCATP